MEPTARTSIAGTSTTSTAVDPKPSSVSCIRDTDCATGASCQCQAEGLAGPDGKGMYGACECALPGQGPTALPAVAGPLGLSQRP